ncbi:MAG: hypothetical protein E6F99_24620 [Actinobacteria bacterium]|nr:MAG: hypothetical protein E6F99_24620 [Actinomycetota bacterium]
MGEPALARPVGPRLRPDTGRVIARLFVPGEELPEGASRGRAVIDRVLGLDDGEVAASMADVTARFATRHRGLADILRANFNIATHGRTDLDGLRDDRRLLIGAYFTMEYAVESAAVCNPSMVAHPDQRGVATGEVRFVMSLRAVGEGHRSSVEFRTGVVGPARTVTLDAPSPVLVAGTRRPVTYERDLFLARLADLGSDVETVDRVVGGLPARFDGTSLRQAVRALHPQLSNRLAGHLAIEQINRVAADEYEVTFPPDTPISERLLWPDGASESNGMEDVRLVRFTGDDGSVTYHGTYTAFDGEHIAPRLLATNDFATFTSGQLAGPAARDKGMALFPRKVGGRYLALSRWDRENVSLGTSVDGRVWHRAGVLCPPREGWQLVQVGNCGSPIETEAGWLVLTHGVGPMRTYRIGAVLLDRADPTRILAALRDPLLSADAQDRDGYVPNVVYSCGALRHGDALIIPYGISDSTIGFAWVELPALLQRMRPTTFPNTPS